MLSWFARRQTRPIDEALWQQTLERHPFLQRLAQDDRERLKRNAEHFLRTKAITAVRGLELTDEICVSIAAQACLPVLRLGPALYDGFVEVVVYPDEFLVERQHVDEVGLVHESTDPLSGETIDGGPVVLSWADVDRGGRLGEGYNVVIHEFVHKIDLLDGLADGTPPLPARRREQWGQVLGAAFDRFSAMLDEIEASIPPDVDPESEAADRFYARLPLDSYAATDEAEFFAVSSEVYFLQPELLALHFFDYYQMLLEYFEFSLFDNSLEVQVGRNSRD